MTESHAAAAAVLSAITSVPTPARSLQAPVERARVQPSDVVADVAENQTAPDVAAPSSDGEPDGATTWSEEAAEAEFLATARERGEVPTPRPTAEAESGDEASAKPLPALEDLVSRIPENVRETLEDLFRAKFVKVQRVPKRVLK